MKKDKSKIWAELKKRGTMCASDFTQFCVDNGFSYAGARYLMNNNLTIQVQAGMVSFRTDQPTNIQSVTTNRRVGVKIEKKKVGYAQKYIPRKIGEMNDLEILNKSCLSNSNILLIGETGTGKTHAVYTAAKELGRKVVRVNLDKAVTPEDLIGEYKPNGEAGKFVWCDGLLVTAMKEGWVLMCDEINAAPPEVMFYLNSILDNDRRITIKQHLGEEIAAHENFVFIATMNPETYKGVNQLNAALLDRFDVVLFYDYDEATERKLGIDSKLIKFASKIRTSYIMGEVSQPVSTRGLLQYLRNVDMFGEDVAKEILISKFPLDEKKAVKEVFEMVVEGNQPANTNNTSGN